jgi:hypothetical protein
MSLIRLLAAGSSLRGIKDHPSPYKMTQDHLLPKFGSNKDAEPQEQGLMPTPASPPALRPARETLPSPGTIPPASGNEIRVAGADAATPSAPPAPTKGGPFLRWAHGKNPFRPKLAVKKRPVPVQGELLLEGVKVVRNDLNETDLEVVPAIKPPEGPPTPTPGGASPETARRSWRRIAERLFGRRRP